MARPWTVHLELLGTSFHVQSEDEDIAAEIRRLWRPLVSDELPVAGRSRFAVARTPGGWTATQGETILGSAADSHVLLHVLSTHLNSAAINRARGLVVHAGAVARGADVVALAGPSGAGKSTLTAACVALRWGYVSDEAVQVCDDGRVSVYPKPLALSAWSRSSLGLTGEEGGHDGEQLVSIDQLQGRVSAEPLRLAEVVFLNRSQDAPRGPALRPLHASEALTGLLALSFNHYKDPRRSVLMLAAAAQQCRAWRLQYSDARQAASLLSQAFPARLQGDAGPGQHRPSASGAV